MSDSGRHFCDWDRCGYGTPWGCDEFTSHPARLLLNGRRSADNRGWHDEGHVTFHLACWPDIATVPAFSKGYAAEEARGVA